MLGNQFWLARYPSVTSALSGGERHVSLFTEDSRTTQGVLTVSCLGLVSLGALGGYQRLLVAQVVCLTLKKF